MTARNKNEKTVRLILDTVVSSCFTDFETNISRRRGIIRNSASKQSRASIVYSRRRYKWDVISV